MGKKILKTPPPEDAVKVPLTEEEAEAYLSYITNAENINIHIYAGATFVWQSGTPPPPPPYGGG
jgi:hypothetical protein